MLIICACCGRQRNVEKRKRGTYKCNNCGAKAARVIIRIKHWMMVENIDGIDGKLARHATMARLKYYAEMKGYKPGWASFKFKMLFGCWPNGESVEEPQVPTTDLMKWMWKQAAEYSRLMRKKEAAALKPLVPEPKSELMTKEDWDFKH
jgi:hypothetical protein